MAAASIMLNSPWVMDLVLLLRLYAVFPMATTPTRTMGAVFSFTVCVKMARLGCNVANTVQWARAAAVAQQPLATIYSPNNVRVMHSALVKVAVTFALVDHMCVELGQTGAVILG
jgi:hypothetical protein